LTLDVGKLDIGPEGRLRRRHCPGCAWSDSNSEIASPHRRKARATNKRIRCP